MSLIFEKIKLHAANIPGWRTKRKIVVFESDDWGSIRCPDKNDHKKFLELFRGQINSPYLRYDTLASEDDLNALFNILTLFKDKNGAHPIFTFNTVVANPDFIKIRESDFKQYFFEPFTDTLSRFSKHGNSFQLWKEAIDHKLMFPQFHGREHLNVPVWLRLLQQRKAEVLKAFELNNWATPHHLINLRVRLQSALDYEGEQPLNYQKGFIREGLDLFEQIFGFRAETMIPNNFIINPNLYSIASQAGIRGMQGMRYLLFPLEEHSRGKRRKSRRNFGLNKASNLVEIIRNCTFEPSITHDSFDDVGKCLQEINNAFYWKKPAIITTHRLNYIGHLNSKNRDSNLNKLNILIDFILKSWPEVNFLSSNELINEIKRNP